MTDLVTLLEQTPAAQWHRKVRDHPSRLTYYRALCSCLYESEPGAAFTGKMAREQVVAEAGHTSASSLYRVLTVEGRQRPPVDGLLTLPPLESPELPESPASPDIVERLVLEAKIWDYWPHRVGWIKGLAGTVRDDRRFAATTMIATLAGWAADHPHLAMAGAGAAPLIAAHDLRVLLDGEVPVVAAESLLARVVEYAVGPLGTAVAVVVDTVYDELMDLCFEREPYVRGVLERLMPLLEDVAYFLPRLPETARAEVGGKLAPSFEEILRLANWKGDR